MNELINEIKVLKQKPKRLNLFVYVLNIIEKLINANNRTFNKSFNKSFK